MDLFEFFQTYPEAWITIWKSAAGAYWATLHSGVHDETHTDYGYTAEATGISPQVVLGNLAAELLHLRPATGQEGK